MIKFNNLDKAPSYAALKAAAPADLRKELTVERIQKSSIPIGGGLTFNFACRSFTETTLTLLQKLADEQQLIEKYKMLLSGEVMNTGEKRLVMHQLTRGECLGPVEADGRDLGRFYREQLERIAAFADKVHKGEITGSTGKPFEKVVQIGIGGSDLGPRALCLALETAAAADGTLKLKTGFISNVDPDDASAVLNGLNFETTLFILVSKSGTTQETLANRALVLKRMADAAIPGLNPSKHMVAVTSATSPLAQSDEYLDSFYIDDYIGGRYSSTSAVGAVILTLAFGSKTFNELLAGAHEADLSALTPEIAGNAALADALLGVFERMHGFSSTAVLPYSQALVRFPAHLQQLDMESNGKSVNRFGEPVAYPTGPVLFGEPGTNGQHSFYQLLHQGTDTVPLQFIGFTENQGGLDLSIDGSTNQRKLNANLAAQITAFALGKDNDNPNKRFAGNRYSSLIYGRRLTPRALGALLAHFENKVMFQGFLWNLNSFDQEGVQLGKVLTKKVLGNDMSPELAAFDALLNG